MYDIRVCGTGPQNLTALIPRTVDEIEAWMAENGSPPEKKELSWNMMPVR
jgi:hypothetical protein